MTFPSDLNAGTAAQRQTVQDLKHTVMIQSALPGAVTFLTCIFGVVSFTIAMFGDHRFGYTVLNCQRACLLVPVVFGLQIGGFRQINGLMMTVCVEQVLLVVFVLVMYLSLTHPLVSFLFNST